MASKWSIFDRKKEELMETEIVYEGDSVEAAFVSNGPAKSLNFY